MKSSRGLCIDTPGFEAAPRTSTCPSASHFSPASATNGEIQRSPSTNRNQRGVDDPSLDLLCLGRVPRLTEPKRRHSISLWSLDQRSTLPLERHCTHPHLRFSQTVATLRRLPQELTSSCVGLGLDPRTRILRDIPLQRHVPCDLQNRVAMSARTPGSHQSEEMRNPVVLSV